MIPSTNQCCYCDLWETDPQFLRDQGVPQGYCGLCSSEVKGKQCGKPGHVRAHPRAPVTSCWCDEHYEVVETGFNPVILFNWLIVISVVGGLGWLLITWLR